MTLARQMLDSTSSLIHSLYPPTPPFILQAELSSLVSLVAPHPRSQRGWKSHFLSLKPSRSHSPSLMSDPDPQKPLGELSLRKWIHFQYTFSMILILDPLPFCVTFSMK